VRLESESPDITILHYEVDAQIGGKLAQLGGRLIDSTARKLAGEFFAAFGAAVGEPADAPVEAEAERKSWIGRLRGRGSCVGDAGGKAAVIARSVSDEAIHGSFAAPLMDCFAEPVIGRRFAPSAVARRSAAYQERQVFTTRMRGASQSTARLRRRRARPRGEEPPCSSQ
jgi:hypothetical protein